MKIFKRLIIWILISLILQLPVLYYLNSLFKATGDIEVTQVNLNSNSNLRTMYRLPSGVENSTIRISSNGGFMAYIQDKKLKVKDLQSGGVKTVSGSDMLVDKVDINGKKEYQPVYEWVPDRDTLLVGYISNKDGMRSIKLIQYSPITNTKSDGIEPIQGAMEGRYISAIQSSPLNNVVYFKIDGKNRRTKLYRFDIMKDGKREIQTGVDFIGNISELQYVDNDEKDRLYFESLKMKSEDGNYSYEPYQEVVSDVYGNKSYITRYRKIRQDTSEISKNDSDSSIGEIYVVKSSRYYSESNKFNTMGERVALVGINNKSQVFLGKVNPDTKEVEKIYMTSIDGDTHVSVELPFRSIDRKNIIIVDNDLYVNDIYSSQLIGLTNRNRIDYNGKFIQIVQDRIVTIVGGKMYIKKISK